MNQNEQKIDIERECLRPLAYNTPEKWVAFVEKIAARIEEQTIQRCVALTLKMDIALTDESVVPRLYATPEGSKSK